MGTETKSGCLGDIGGAAEASAPTIANSDETIGKWIVEAARKMREYMARDTSFLFGGIVAVDADTIHVDAWLLASKTTSSTSRNSRIRWSLLVVSKTNLVLEEVVRCCDEVLAAKREPATAGTPPLE